MLLTILTGQTPLTWRSRWGRRWRRCRGGGTTTSQANVGLTVHLCCNISKRGTIGKPFFIINKSNDVFPIHQKKLLPRPFFSRNHKLEPIRTILATCSYLVIQYKLQMHTINSSTPLPCLYQSTCTLSPCILGQWVAQQLLLTCLAWHYLVLPLTESILYSLISEIHMSHTLQSTESVISAKVEQSANFSPFFTNP